MEWVRIIKVILLTLTSPADVVRLWLPDLSASLDLTTSIRGEIEFKTFIVLAGNPSVRIF